MFVVVMTQMRLAIHRVRKPHRERGEPDEHVDERPARRMPVYEFVLERHIPARQQREQRDGRSEAERARVQGDAEPAAVDRDDDRPGRPFATPAPCVAFVLEFVALRVVEIAGHGGLRERRRAILAARRARPNQGIPLSISRSAL
jgi:hypothetical protein